MPLASESIGPTQQRSPEGESAAALFDLLPLGLILLDASTPDLATLHCNRFAEQVSGPAEDWAKRWCAQAAPPGGRTWRQILADASANGKPVQFKALRFAGPAGDARMLNLEFAPLQRDGRRALLIIVSDVTREEELARRLAATENLAAVGRLAARVAHELNNPLDGALRYVGLALRRIEQSDAAAGPAGGDKLGEYLHQVRDGLLRMTRIVADLLGFSRNAPLIREQTNINRVVEEALHALSHHADANRVTVLADFHDDPQMPVLEDTRLYQVCSNLIRNAIDAMPDGGQLSVHTGIVDQQVLIRIADTGCGLPDTVERVFEPLYTTKPAGKGTGLGLAICRDYLAALGGRISAENIVTGGAAFTVRIPLASCREKGSEAVSAAAK
jgi:signal transduction histidine kinase